MTVQELGDSLIRSYAGDGDLLPLITGLELDEHETARLIAYLATFAAESLKLNAQLSAALESKESEGISRGKM